MAQKLKEKSGSNEVSKHVKKYLPRALVILIFVGIAVLGQPLLAQTYSLPNDNTGCPSNCRSIPWKAGSDLWNGGVLPVYSPQVTCSAAVGDGSTDNTSALNNCIAAAASGSAVYLPSGSFYINGTVRLKSNVVLRGAGPNTLILEGPSGWLTTQNFSHSTNITPATNYNQIPTTYTLSGTPQKGDTTLTIGSGNVSIGTWIKVFGNDDPRLISDPGGSCDYCADDTGAVSDAADRPGDGH